MAFGVKSIIGLMFGILALGAIGPTAFDWLGNLSTSLSSHPWAYTMILFGCIIAVVTAVMPRK